MAIVDLNSPILRQQAVASYVREAIWIGIVGLNPGTVGEEKRGEERRKEERRGEKRPWHVLLMIKAQGG